MGLLIVFSNHPKTRKKFLFGIETQQALEELAKLFNTTVEKLLKGDITLRLPDKAKISQLKVTSQELKNVLDNFSNEEIYIHPDFDPENEKFSISDEVLTIP